MADKAGFLHLNYFFMKRYGILQNGRPALEHALEYPCYDKDLAQKEVDRLNALVAENNKKAAQYKPTGERGECFMRPRHRNDVYTLGEESA